VPKTERHGGRRRFESMRSAAAVSPWRSQIDEALQRRASVRPLVGCYAELGARVKPTLKSL
jgi:hypothetical protein